jgi:hypothetical protein
MGGLAVLSIIGLYVWGAMKIFKCAKPIWAKALVVIAAVLIPSVDALWGRYVVLPELCEDAGLKVLKKADKAGGLFQSGNPSDYWNGNPDDYWIGALGVAFVEGQVPGGPYMRFSIVDRSPVLEENVTPHSKYLLTSWMPLSTERGNSFSGYELRIESRESGEVLARFRRYAFGGGWVEQLLGKLADSGPQAMAGCPSVTDSTSLAETLIRATYN